MIHHVLICPCSTRTPFLESLFWETDACRGSGLWSALRKALLTRGMREPCLTTCRVRDQGLVGYGRRASSQEPWMLLVTVGANDAGFGLAVMKVSSDSSSYGISWGNWAV